MRKLFIALGLSITTFTSFAERNPQYEVMQDDKVIANIQVRQLQSDELLITRQSVNDDTNDSAKNSTADAHSSMLTATFKGQQLTQFSFSSTKGDKKTVEKFSQQGNIIRWTSPKDEGAEQVNEQHIYFTPEFTPVYIAEVIKRIGQHSDQPINVAPGGIFHINNVQSFTDPKTQEKLSLYKVMGRSVRPDYIWLTSQLAFAAAFERGDSYYNKRFKSILPTLQKIKQTEENAHWAKVSKQLSHAMPDSLLIKDVRIFDAKNARFLAGQSVLIQDGKIIRVAPRVRVPKRTKIIDGKGKTLIPALWDMHAHVYELGGIFQIAAGVTNARDKGNGAEIIERKQKMDNAQLIGPRLYLSGFIDKRSDFNTGVTPPVDTLDEAFKRIDAFKAQGYSDIKLYGSIPTDWVKPIGEKAHKLGMTLTGHIPQGMKSSDAIEAGFDEVTHSNFLLLEFLNIADIDTRTRSRHTYSAEHGGSIRLDSKDTQAFIKLLKKHRTIIDPTLVGYTAMFTQQEGQFDPRLAAAKQHLPPRVYQSFMTPQMEVTASNRTAYKASAITLTSLIKLLIDNNIPVVPGTDDLPGLVLHNELLAYHRMGVPIANVLKIATLSSAEVAKQENKFGSISSGKVADLVLIEGDLSQDLSLLSHASLVIKGEHYFIPRELYKAVGVRSFTNAEAGL